MEELLQLDPVKKYIQEKQFNYQHLKDLLIDLRYPLSSREKRVFSRKNIFLPKIDEIPDRKEYTFSGKFIPKQIYIESSVLKNIYVQNILRKFFSIPHVIIKDLKGIKWKIDEHIQELGKQDLYLTGEIIDLFKNCPCTKNVLSCDYFVINTAFGCPYDCSYCYLQHYSNFPGIIIPVNIEVMIRKLDALLKKSRRKLRIGTGEFTDSLIFEDLIPYSEHFISLFKEAGHILELKTKSVNIENILRVKAAKNIVIAWSLNTPYCIKKEEYYTPTLHERLKAAQTVIKKGYKVGFHFDPIIYYPEWEKDYQNTVGSMFDHAEGNIEWISLGALRFHRSLKPIIEKRFPKAELLNGELLIDEKDHKMRYPEFIRVEMFRKMVEWIRKNDKKVIIYLCMEHFDIWKKVFKISSKEYQYSKGICYLG